MTHAIDAIDANRLTSAQLVELGQMQRMLLEVGYTPERAYELFMNEGIGIEELKERLKEKNGLCRTHGAKFVHGMDEVEYCIIAVDKEMIENGALFLGTKTSEQIYRKVAKFIDRKLAKEYILFLQAQANPNTIYFLAYGRFRWGIIIVD